MNSVADSATRSSKIREKQSTARLLDRFRFSTGPTLEYASLTNSTAVFSGHSRFQMLRPLRLVLLFST